jgi:hypothetical protein
MFKGNNLSKQSSDNLNLLQNKINVDDLTSTQNNVNAIFEKLRLNF